MLYTICYYKNVGGSYVSEISGLHPVYKIERKFLKGTLKDLSSSKKTGNKEFDLEEGKFYEINPPFKGRRIVKIENDKMVEITLEEVIKIFKEQQSEEVIVEAVNDLNAVEEELQSIKITTKSVNENLYNLLTKEPYKSYSTWMISIGFQINGIEVKALVKSICKKYNSKIEELERKKIEPENLMKSDLVAFFTDNQYKNIDKELEGEYKKTIGNDRINTLLFG